MLSIFQFCSFRLLSTSIHVSNQMKQLMNVKQFRKVINLFDSYIQHDIPTDLIINQTLKACIELKNFERGKEIHRNLSAQSMNNSFIQYYLIQLYIKCNDLKNAQDIFNASTNKTSPMYNLMMKGLADNGQAKEALKLFQQMNLQANEYLLTTIFKICTQISDSESLQFGKFIFKTLPVIYKNHTIVLNSALNMFMQNGEISTGEHIFDKIQKDLITYGVMMSGYVKHNQAEKAIKIFFKIKKPDEINFMLFFNACAQLRNEEALKLGKQVLSQFLNEFNQKNAKSLALYGALDMFIKCDDVKSAEILFTQLNKNVVCYGSLMKMYNDKNEPEKTLNLFEQMKQKKIEPNETIFVLIINACAQIADLSKCESILLQVPNDCLNNIWIQSALIDMWGKSGSAERAKHIFEIIQRPDAVTFAAMINSYALNGMGIQAIELFRQVPLDMLNEWIYVSVLNGCSHSGIIQEARKIFNEIPINQKTNKIYTTMIDAFSRCYFINEAQELIAEFEKSNLPDIVMYMVILSASRNQRNASLAQKIFDRIQFHFPDYKDSLVSATVLLANTYALSNDSSMAFDLRMKLNKSGMKKVPGLSSTVVKGKIFKFRAHDRPDQNVEEFDAEMDLVSKELVENGYKHDSSWITRQMMEDETPESLLCGHSERIAIVFNLCQRPVPSLIQVTKNLRVCGSCHEFTKLIARIRQIKIIVRDANRIHHFHPNGQCSCQDHF